MSSTCPRTEFSFFPDGREQSRGEEDGRQPRNGEDSMNKNNRLDTWEKQEKGTVADEDLRQQLAFLAAEESRGGDGIKREKEKGSPPRGEGRRVNGGGGGAPWSGENER